MDEADYGNARAEEFLKASREEAAFQLKQMKAVPFSGSCLYCGDPTEPNSRFCSPECGKDHAWYVSSKRRAGQ